MKLYRTYYRAIGFVIAIIGCALTPFIPKLISGDIPNVLPEVIFLSFCDLTYFVPNPVKPSAVDEPIE